MYTYLHNLYTCIQNCIQLFTIMFTCLQIRTHGFISICIHFCKQVNKIRLLVYMYTKKFTLLTIVFIFWYTCIEKTTNVV